MKIAWNLRLRGALFGAIALAVSPLRADPQPQVALVQVGTTEQGDPIFEGTWAGVSLRTYFVEYSLDFVTWDYLPVVRFGTGEQHCGLILEGTSQIYMRLVCVDDTDATTLQEARDMDFDGDKVPNAFEVEVLRTDPLNGADMEEDSDEDGLPDGLELYYFGSLNQSGSDDTDGDGISNADEFAGSTHPADADTDGDGIPDGIDPSPLSGSMVSLPSASGAIHVWAPSEP